MPVLFIREHDYNEDGRLDGLELLQALQHEMPFHTNEDNMENLPYVERKKRRQQWQQQWLEQITSNTFFGLNKYMATTNYYCYLFMA